MDTQCIVRKVVVSELLMRDTRAQREARVSGMA